MDETKTTKPLSELAGEICADEIPSVEKCEEALRLASANHTHAAFHGTAGEAENARKTEIVCATALWAAQEKRTYLANAAPALAAAYLKAVELLEVALGPLEDHQDPEIHKFIAEARAFLAEAEPTQEKKL